MGTKIVLYKGKICKVINKYKNGVTIEVDKDELRYWIGDRLKTKGMQKNTVESGRYWWIINEFTEVPDCPLVRAIYGTE